MLAHTYENIRNELREEELNYITLVKKKYIYIYKENMEV